MTLTGSLAGSLGAAGVLWWLEARPESWWAPVVLPTTGGTIGFNLTRRYREQPAERSDGAHLMHRGPALDLHPGLSQCQNRQAHYVNLVNVKF